ncbi:hypothetical protein [Candidatus Magnetomonas plexicatena]|uniref:hypothetical protein n=1 Tax=Candidatus Magnetomonas plexicatena TaxID=2552947 RepID=UPI00110533DB|nr:hypothetical protein E2O03_009070 [Nitrospirales bacterium LBB_01]
MDDLEKLKSLIHHWRHHNDDHAHSYLEWAEKMAAAGRDDLYHVLVRIFTDARKLNELFDEAAKILGGDTHSGDTHSH